MKRTNEWAIVLAGGDGTRLSGLTDVDGTRIPKQFWAVRGAHSLLRDALRRAWRLVARERTVVVVAEQHRAFWEDELRELPSENVIVQPENRGTAPGLLLPLASILARDPDARLLVLPADHFVAQEAVLSAALREALDAAASDQGRVVLLGISPASPETGYGWVVPRGHGLGPLDSFVEKPPAGVARDLMGRGALWNSFLMAADGQELLRLFARRLPELTDCFLRRGGAPGAARLGRLYADLEPVDFSRSVLQGGEERLWLLRVPECGWTDLGTPERVAECLSSLRVPGRRRRTSTRNPQARFRLLEALERCGLHVHPTPA